MKQIKATFMTLLLTVFCLSAAAQMQDPVHFSVSQKKVAPDEIEVIFTAKIDAGWHVYSTGMPDGGPTSANVHTDVADGVKPAGPLTPRGKVISQHDEMFGMTLRFFEKTATFVQKYKITAKTYHVKGYLEYGACNDQMCMPPTTVEFDFKGQGPADAPEAAEDEAEAKGDTVAVADSAATDSMAAAVPANVDTTGLWTPVIDELQAMNGDQGSGDRSWLYIFVMGFLGGLVALFTPCVWPIIPMTVSFFLKRSKDKKKGIRDAITYGISIVVIYLVLGLAITAILGASALNALSTNAVFNIFFCLLLIVFAASFFGAFEITLPSSWSNKIDRKSESTSGILSIFLMAFTLVLVSFSCTGPIIGLLLVAVSTQDNIIAPTIGMFGFAVALAIPFTLFAMFPSLLKSAPKSGGWMNVIKVVLGFIELAFALKFLSVADLAYGWHILDRETFIALWIAIFGLLGLYLLGMFNFPHDDENRRTNVPQFFLALISLAFTVYMVPGLWGAPLKAISAFTPPMNTQDFNLYKNEVHPRFKDFEAGMAAARLEGKPVMIDFTGFGCVNCREMEAAVWTDANVADMLNNKYVLISLYVDDKTPLDQPITVTENGKQRTLRTVGDKWSYLQRVKFGANTQPFYVLLDNEGHPLTGSRSYDKDISEYLKFLQTGLDRFKK